jgi:recombination protein RecA
MVYLNLTTVEDIFDKIEEIIELTRKQNSDKKRVVTIVVDSLAAASTKKEIASDHGADGFATQKAIAISKAMRKITEVIAKQNVLLVFTNQLRQKLGFVGVGDPWTTSGGKAVAFHASLRLRLKAMGRITTADKNVVGIKTKCTVIKNRMGPPLRSVEFDIFFDRGIDNYGNWLENLVEWDIVTNAKKVKVAGEKKSKKQMEEEKEADKKAKSLQFIMEVEGKEPETVVFEKKDFPKLLLERPDCRDYLYNKMCGTYIMKYRTASNEIADDIELDDSNEGMED